MNCKHCGTPINDAVAAADYDAGVPTWNFCDQCARLWDVPPEELPSGVDTVHEKGST